MRCLASALALLLASCGGAPANTPTTSVAEPTSTPTPSPAPPPIALAPYELPIGTGAFDVVARDASVRIYAAISLDDERVLDRFDLDLDGHATRPAPITLSRDASSSVVAVAVAAIGQRDLVVLCDQGEDEATRYQALWVDLEGAVLETVALGTFPAEDGVYAPCFVTVAPSGIDRAIVVHGRDSLACPRYASDDDIEQCPAFRGVTLTPGAAPEDDFRVSTAEARLHVVGTASGWAWGLGPFAMRASIVLRYAEIPETATLLQADVLDGFIATPDTIVALVSRRPGVAVFRGAEVPTGNIANMRDELPVVPAERTLACVDGAVTATVTAGDLTVAVRAGADRTSVPWDVFAGDPAFSSTAADGRVYLMHREDGSLRLLDCASGQPESRDVAWFAP